MNDQKIAQNPSSIFQTKVRVDEIRISPEDAIIIKGLAEKTAGIAAKPVQKEKRNRWICHNSLKKTRPLIFCDPENGWNEIVDGSQLRCRGRLAREWEIRLHKEIFWGERMDDDRVIEPFFDLNYVYEESDWGVHETVIGGKDGGSYVWDAPIKEWLDLGKLRFPEIRVNYPATEKLKELAEEVLGEWLDVRIQGLWWWSLGLTHTLIKLRGFSQVLYDMHDFPKGIHRLMAFLRDGIMAKLDFLQDKGLLSLNIDKYVGSGGFGYTEELPAPGFVPGMVRTVDMWGFCESQETTSVSPRMFEEFIFQYQFPILSRFGLNCYGCCEAMDRRWEVVKKTPRLRRISVSPWSNLTAMAEKIGSDYIFSLKPNPAHLASPVLDEDLVRKELREAIRIARNCRLEIIMKDNHTIGRNPDNVVRWCRIAREEAES